MKIRSNKGQVLTAIIAVFSLTFFMFSYQSYRHTKAAFEQIETISESSINNLFEEASAKMLKKNLSEKSNDLVLLLKKDDIFDLIEKNKREEIVSWLQPYYDTLKKQLPQFNIMNLLDADGTAILRMHAKEVYGDDLKKFRTHIKDIVLNPKKRSFYEVGRYGFYFRQVTPLYKDNRLIGFLELGMSPTLLIDKIEKVFGAKGYILAKRNAFITDSNESIAIGEYMLSRCCNKKESFLLSILPQLKIDKKSYRVKLNNKIYQVTTKSIYDGFKKEIGKFLQFKDVTFFSDQLFALLLNSVILYIFSILAIYLIFNNYIGQLLGKLNLANDTLKKQNNEMKRLNELISNSVLYSTSDLDGNITYVSKAFEEFTGYKSKELIGKNHKIFKHKDMKKEFFENMWNTLNLDRQFKGEVKNRKKDGSSYWIELTIDPMFDESNKKIGYAAYREDITDKKKLEYMSSHDKLTKLHNRYELEKNLRIRFKSAIRYGHKFGYIMFDIDHFKAINDKYGHHVGDSVLVRLSEVISSALREDDFIARWGGEEFVILTPESSRSELILLVKKLQDEIAKTSFEPVPSITVSFGLTVYKDEDNEDSLQQRADSALYIAKENGRNRYEIL